ncbi:negative regulation of DNA damage response, signal transduction by p53 class mediator [Desmophyllum pertusum]|uniref:Negative regulation of DNA damage response, signal transduction by p53 class mediator n=1 Tax=Desmophyllum pertusum TaxID=174260 RepID=A0A9X0D7R0_9CNID|nr:negative regulation of DNA damage response, signal transduction by p53 class mediator [Desmophyllum pertusum]
MSASTTARTTFQSSSPSTAAPVTTKSNGTRTTVAPTSIPAITCSQRNASCGDCIQDINCFWCGADDTCKDYQATSNLIPDCKGNNWYWKECFVAGHLLIYIIPSVAFVVLVIIGCCVYCLCCRNRRQKSYESGDKKMQKRREETQRRNAERRAERRIKTDAIRQKYGLLTNEDDAEVA